MNGLFDDDEAPPTDPATIPLAERMRPRTLDEVAGQEDLVGPGRPLREMIERDRLQSIILWGPPGTGKTTLARLVAELTRATFVSFSAVLSGIKEVKEVMAAAEDRRRRLGARTIVFVDEIHRFNKAQQDAFLPRMEAGDIVLIGATTENPSFEVNAPLLSRSRVVVLKALSDDDIAEILRRALADEERGLGAERLSISDDALALLVNLANGDARFALNTLEMASVAVEPDGDQVITAEMVAEAAQRRAAVYDKDGEAHFDTISALHKSIRDSDADATMYWLARMLEGGDDPLYIARRLVRAATEDVGLADPRALQVAMAAQQAVHFLGVPEGNLALAEAAIYIALAPKSNALYKGYAAAREDVQKTRNDPVPMHLRNAVTGLMRGLGYGAGYKYAHDDPDAVVDQDDLPENLAGRRYFDPTSRGFEGHLVERIEERRELLARKRKEQGKK